MQAEALGVKRTDKGRMRLFLICLMELNDRWGCVEREGIQLDS